LVETLRDGKEACLDIWAAERHQIATGVVLLTDRLTRMATLKSGVGRAFRNAGMTIAGRFPPVRAAIARKLAELDAR
jgi:2-polyprenyl-6-methoxyphenol hydroxylase-like FAD-dependent oxidoreductase